MHADIESDSIVIYVVAHKDFDFPHDRIYVPIQVGSGAAFKPRRQGCARDDAGVSIAEKNRTFCELTAAYWIWKNDQTSDIVGLVHYRRYLSSRWWTNQERYFLDKDNILAALSKYDIILPEQFTWKGYSVATAYELGAGRRKDLQKVGEIINERYPECYPSFEDVISSRSASYCNMIVCKKALFDEYCEWLFSILFELESTTDLSGYTAEEMRIYGYLSEILLNVWVKQRNLKVKTYPIVKTNEPVWRKILRKIKHGKYYIP